MVESRPPDRRTTAAVTRAAYNAPRQHRTTRRSALRTSSAAASSTAASRARRRENADTLARAGLLAVELYSLTVQRDDVSVPNLISCGLFGDGAAAVVLVGAAHPRAGRSRPRVLDSLAHFFPHTERTMGWDVVDGGFKIVLDRKVPAKAREGLPPLVDGILARSGLAREDVRAWVMHPGGPAVMQGTLDGLGLPPEALAETPRSLAEVGNLSSASVLCVLDDFRKRVHPAPGSHGLLIAMGPAFSAEAVLLQW